MRILLIDDDQDDQILFREAVNIISPDITCDIVNNGVEGLSFLNASHTLPELVFLDINMPGMDGRQTFNLIKATPKLKGLHITFYSTSTNKEEILTYTKSGASYITKPNSFTELVSTLSKPIIDAAQSNYVRGIAIA